MQVTTLSDLTKPSTYEKVTKDFKRLNILVVLNKLTLKYVAEGNVSYILQLRKVDNTETTQNLQSIILSPSYYKNVSRKY